MTKGPVEHHRCHKLCFSYSRNGLSVYCPRCKVWFAPSMQATPKVPR